MERRTFIRGLLRGVVVTAVAGPKIFDMGDLCRELNLRQLERDLLELWTNFRAAPGEMTVSPDVAHYLGVREFLWDPQAQRDLSKPRGPFNRGTYVPATLKVTGVDSNGEINYFVTPRIDSKLDKVPLPSVIYSPLPEQHRFGYVTLTREKQRELHGPAVRA
jgi:hypothetical protein